jgi:hypothetical protein
MEHYSIKHYGVNGIRAMPQNSNIIATWATRALLNLFNVESIMQRFSMREGKGSALHYPIEAIFQLLETRNGRICYRLVFGESGSS